MSIIFLILGIIYVCRRPKFSNLTSDQFAGVPTEKFMEWRKLELRSIDVFLWAVGGLFVISLLGGMVLATSSWSDVVRFNIGIVVIFLVMLIISAVAGSQAAELKKEFNISPRPVQCKRLKGSRGEVIGLWIANPNDPNFKAFVEEFNATEVLPQTIYQHFKEGAYRIVPNRSNKAGGAFLMFGNALAPGERGVTTGIQPPISLTSEDTFTFTCPTCGQHISANPSAAGTSGICPGCNNEVIVPTIDK